MTDTAKHTLGPWAVFQKHHSQYIFSASHVICWLVEDTTRISDDERVANGRLIAKAPELLDALKALSALLPPDLQVKVDKLVAEAEGR